MRVRLPFEFDVDRMQAELADVRDSEWIAHYNPNDHEGAWHLAALSAPAGLQESIWSCAIPEICQPTPLLRRSSYFALLLDEIPVVKTSVRLMRLAPGAVIKEHCDSFGDEEIRIHVPVTTNPEVDFRFAGEPVSMQKGSCWLLDFRLPHSVANHGPTARTHLVIDAFRNDWVEQQLRLC